ncbi:PRC-barrel domain-containing protein [Streptomyces sp. Qhu-G9]|uniref:PRC-barrel domain-containing protein n=1 Tax=Streptomyces sp. Qhu-G9 TaxID=3452799 RepID=UPI0022AC3BCA|nr:PRC-barrel domain-containing protein [Streptomyces aurantiacus]WAU82765.1 PRC-barrel domain-containing protein [Streptomyces aurantiacus]
MVRAADIREWRNQDVVDLKGRWIGVLEAVRVDTTTDEPAVATVRTGLPTRQRLVFVPLDEVLHGRDYLKVSNAKRLARKAPSIGADDVLPAEQEEAFFHDYGM